MRATPCGDDPIRYFPSRLGKSTTPDSMDSILEANIMKKINKDVSEMCGEASDRYVLYLDPTSLAGSLDIDAILQETTITGNKILA